MSTAELNRARERVLALARQIEDLSHPETPEETYFPEFIKRLLSAVGAPAGVIWMKGPSGNVGPKCEQGLDATGYRTTPQADGTQQTLDKLREIGLLGSFRMGQVFNLTCQGEHPLACPIQFRCTHD